MFRSIVSSLVVFGLLFPAQLWGQICQQPFSGVKQFQLLEQLNCNQVTSPVTLMVSNLNGTQSASSYYLSPGCDGTSIYFNLKDKNTILDFSDTLASAEAHDIGVLSACNGKKLFQIDRHPKLYTLADGTKVNTSLRVFSADANGSLIAYAVLDEDTANALTLRDGTQQVLATATKAFSQTGAECHATWSIQNSQGSEQISTVMSYLLTLKDNSALDCKQATSSAPASSFSAPAVIAGVVIGAVLVLAGGIGVACYCAKNNPRYAKLRLIE